jgi:surfactin family lipopeptide synthetase A
VLQPHNNVLSLLDATEDLYQFNDNDVWLLFHSYVFDFTVWEIWGALIYGGKLIIPNKHQIRDFAELHQLCKDTGVTVLNQTPSAFYQFSEAILKNNNQHLSKLRYIIFGGEKLNFSGLASWFNSFYRNKPQLFNMYGITELTVLSTFKIIKPDDLGSVSCIGKILPQQTCYVLDSNLSILPLGAIGELHIGGERLAKGYLNQPMLTKERFIPNPFQTEKEKMLGINSQLYKTGDLVRLLLSGDLEYITRNDSQVKIRGYRIELGAIEATLTKYPGITQAVVLLKTDSDRIDRPSKYLVAYYRAKKMLDEIKIRDYLARHLNSYMCPTVIIYLNSFPLTVNGKIDIKSLPTRKFKRNIDYVAPSNIQEQLVCEAFSNLLGVNPVGVTDDFFELGGDSLKAITLTARLQTYFAIKVIDIFNFGTPKNIAKRVLLSGNVLKQRLNEVKQIYRQQKSSKKLIAAEINQQEELYLAQIKDIRIDAAKTKNITYVLLTGATGYLGCHLLYQLLKQTDYTIFILIRANTNQEAKERIRKKYKFYFEIDLADLIEKRIFILKGDLELPLLGLTKTVYEKLASRIDSIMHAAALVKHYGAEEKFYSANVQATINLLGFSKLTILKDFHYISTTSVLNFDSVSGNKAYIGTENNAPENLVSSNNIYVKTKLQAECQVVKYRDYGINSNIYRVGNLTINSENCCSQENLHENAFANWLDGLLSMQCIAAEISTVEMSQVDLTAKAIVKLFDREQLVNDTYHIFNPNLVKLTKIFPDIKTLSIEKFVDNVARKLLDRSDNNNESLLRFVLRQGWLEKSDNQYGTAVKLLQSKTAHILQQLNFRWPSITKKQLNAYLEQLRKT